MKRIDIALIIGILASILITSFTAFAGQCGEVREEVVRIHVLANSNSDEDQALKLQVRDAVLEGTQEIFTSAGNKEEIEAMALEHLGDIQKMAQEEIYRQGYNYQARAAMVNMYFNTRQYGDVTLPAGYYDAVRLTIGSGEGDNWWCVMFPPMCIPAASSEGGQELEEQITQLGQTPRYKAKFAVVELVESIRDQWEDRQETSLEG